jgi:hypothetical protein
MKEKLILGSTLPTKLTMHMASSNKLIEMALISKNKLFRAIMCSNDGLVLLAVLLISLKGMTCDL